MYSFDRMSKLLNKCKVSITCCYQNVTVRNKFCRFPCWLGCHGNICPAFIFYKRCRASEQPFSLLFKLSRAFQCQLRKVESVKTCKCLRTLFIYLAIKAGLLLYFTANTAVVAVLFYFVKQSYQSSTHTNETNYSPLNSYTNNFHAFTFCQWVKMKCLKKKHLEIFLHKQVHTYVHQLTL